VEYNGSVATADAFFANPWLMDMPSEVSDACWDVILVDAPEGFDATMPGMPDEGESTH
jgi:hypothetical protein